LGDATACILARGMRLTGGTAAGMPAAVPPVSLIPRARKRTARPASIPRDPGPVPSRPRRLLTDHMARTPYGWQHGTWSSSSEGQGAVETPRPGPEKLGAVREDPDLIGLLFRLI